MGKNINQSNFPPAKLCPEHHSLFQSICSQLGVKDLAKIIKHLEVLILSVFQKESANSKSSG